MNDTDNNIRPVRFKRINLFLSCRLHFVTRKERESLDERRICFCLRFGSFETEKSDLDIPEVFYRRCVIEQFSVRSENVCAENLARKFGKVALRLSGAVVKFVVAESYKVIADGVHHGDGIRAFCNADVCRAL